MGEGGKEAAESERERGKRSLPASLVLRVTAGVDDAVHVQVEVVELDIIWIWLGGVHWDL